MNRLPFAHWATWSLFLLLSACATGPVNNGQLPADLATTKQGNAVVEWNSQSRAQIENNIERLIPSYVRDKSTWASDLYTAYEDLKLPQAASTYCASIAVIEQESTFQADPVVPNLPKIVRKELVRRAHKFLIPEILLNVALDVKSPNGQSFNQRIDSLRTERQLNQFFEEMLDQLPLGRKLFSDFIPIKTGGPMQVSVDFAEKFTKEHGYPYPIARSIRDEVFSQRGGIYFGSAILLDYPASYDNVVYRFADFNAGRWASRNAAFQAALSRLTGRKLALDGDLLRYFGDRASIEPSQVELALQSIRERLDLSKSAIRDDLEKEKTAAFSDTRTYNRVYRMAQQKLGKVLPHAMLPGITLESPKITRKLTTAWFARRVESRYWQCMSRQ